MKITIVIWTDTHRLYYIEPQGIRISKSRHSAGHKWEPIYIGTDGCALMTPAEACRYVEAMRKALQLAEKLKRD